MSPSDFAHAHADVLGVKVSALDLPGAVALADRWIAAGNPGYICVTGVHGVMEAQSDPDLRHILNRAVLNTPDGMPMTWVGRIQGHREIDRVSGPDFMLAMCRLAAERGYRIFLYGGQPGVAVQLGEALAKKCPGLQVAGAYTPPFGPLSQREEEEVLAQIHACRPHIVWVGLGAPRQERFMANYFLEMQAPLMIGVGAAFDFHTGRIRDCSQWIKRAGLQWLHRLIQEPRRLWRRYLRNNPAFLWHIAWQLLGLRQYPRNAALQGSAARRDVPLRTE